MAEEVNATVHKQARVCNVWKHGGGWSSGDGAGARGSSGHHGSLSAPQCMPLRTGERERLCVWMCDGGVSVGARWHINKSKRLFWSSFKC